MSVNQLLECFTRSSWQRNLSLLLDKARIFNIYYSSVILVDSKGAVIPNITDKSQFWGKLYSTIGIFVIHRTPFYVY